MDDLVRIVEDDDSLAAAIGELLASVRIDSAHYPDARSFLEEDSPSRPGCMILDVRLPGMSGLDLLRQAKTLGVAVPIVFISAHGDIAMGVSAIKAGAIDFLPKPFKDQALLDAVAAALSHDRARRAHEAERATIDELTGKLTPREREVYDLVVAGKRNREIADALAVSEVTVKMHRGAVMRKLGVGTVVDLVRLAALADAKIIS